MKKFEVAKCGDERTFSINRDFEKIYPVGGKSSKYQALSASWRTKQI